MAMKQQPELERALDEIEECILPSLATMLDTLLDAGTHVRPGADSEANAAELRTLVRQLEAVTRQVEAISSTKPQGIRAASA